MSSAAERARQHLEAEFILQAVLAMGIVNVKGLARWLKENRGIDGSVEAIARGIYKFKDEGYTDAAAVAFEFMRRTSVNFRTGLSALVVEMNGHTAQRISRLVGRVDTASQEVMRIIPGEDTISLVLQADRLSDALGIFGEEAIVHRFEDLHEVHLKTPKEELEHPGLLELVLTSLSLRGINAPFVASGYHEHFVPVPGDRGEEAVQIVKQLKKL